MPTGLATQLLDLAASHMRDLQRDARERGAREAARRGRGPRARRSVGR